MDIFLRFFIKFHGYCIAILGSILTISFTAAMGEKGHYYRHWRHFVNLRYTGIPIFIFGILWMITSSLLFIGILKEKKTFLYPFCSLFSFELFLVIMRDLYLVIMRDHWFRTVFFVEALPFLLFIIPYVSMSMLALVRLFNIDPVNETEDHYVRFDRNAAEDVDRVTIGG